LRVIAEGVENASQLDFLRTAGCDEIQGYWFSKPIDADAYAALLRETNGA
jgi:EAL domain-containing protein (putative c-di-GMP-specific phosphodiesterase class I)